ncbi:hypothetical protein BGZ83_009234 [Gryganskiella cystojenkinii]|nr:hypothetical protein BGZ83_009234 [Gryganskiella cystojenkinii]
MGSLRSVRSFLSSHLQILSPKDQHDLQPKQQQEQQRRVSIHQNNSSQNVPQQQPQVRDGEDYPRFYSIFSELTAMERQRELFKNQFPCEERHSFNPHYQHNLVYSASPPSGVGGPSSASMLMSSPPSLTSSPSSINSSHSSLSRASSSGGGARSFGYRSGSYYGSHHHQHQLQLQLSQQEEYYDKSNAYYSSHNGNPNNYSYHRQHNRRLNQARAQLANQQYEYFEDAMIRYDHHQQNATASPSTVSLYVQTHNLNNKSGSISSRPRSTSRGTVTFSPVTEVYSHPQQQHATISRRASSNSSLNLSFSHLPSISESSQQQQQQRISPAMERRRRLSGAYSEIDVSCSSAAEPFSYFGSDLPALTVTAATTTSMSVEVIAVNNDSSTRESHDVKHMTAAQQSLKRIAQIATHDDGWCSQKAGHYTRQYAESRSRGAQVDGRRNRRL